MPAATTERVRALRLLARYPDGCTEALILAHGFTITFLADVGQRPARDSGAEQRA